MRNSPQGDDLIELARVSSIASALGTGKTTLARRSAEMDEKDVAEMILGGMTHQDISAFYKSKFPSRSGFSERSVRRFCKSHNIHKPSGAFLDTVVRDSVQEV